MEGGLNYVVYSPQYNSHEFFNSDYAGGGDKKKIANPYLESAINEFIAFSKSLVCSEFIL